MVNGLYSSTWQQALLLIYCILQIKKGELNDNRTTSLTVNYYVPLAIKCLLVYSFYPCNSAVMNSCQHSKIQDGHLKGEKWLYILEWLYNFGPEVLLQLLVSMQSLRSLTDLDLGPNAIWNNFKYVSCASLSFPIANPTHIATQAGWSKRLKYVKDYK